MACHYPTQTGHTQPEAGALYVRSLAFNLPMFRYTLRSWNEATGMGTLLSDCGWTKHLSLTELSLWHRVESED